MPHPLTEHHRRLQQALSAIENELADIEGKPPAAVAELEKRMQRLTHELTDTSDKMLAYKLKRLADSKLVAKASTHTRSQTDYQSSTFRCKSDLDQCVLTGRNALEKALCYALFIRCVLKG